MMSPAFSAEHSVTAQPSTRPLELDAEPEQPRPAKRARVAVACSRCKTRKQKCDGENPKCGNCKNLPIACEYVTAAKAIPYGKYEYVKALESKVAELETILLRECPGLTESGRDHYQQSDVSGDANAVPPSLAGHSRTRISLSNGQITSKVGRENGTKTLSPGVAKSDQGGASSSVRDESLEDGSRFGETSGHMTIGRMFGAMVKSQPQTSRASLDIQHSQLSPKSMSLSSDQDYADLRTGPNAMLRMTPHIAERLLAGYWKHISTRWPILYTPEVRSLHERRLELEDPFEISTLSLIYAISGRFLETTGEPGQFFPEQHYHTAVQHLDKLLQDHDSRAVQTLLLHAVYCLRAPRRPGAWTYIGLATRICIELGFHRRISPNSRPRLQAEMRRRIFWSCYCLDRQVSIILGRPFAISDRDIDADLPFDVDESATEETLEAFESRIPPELPGLPKLSTSMSCFIHITRLRRIESSIQQSVYRVDKMSSLPSGIIERFLEELELWKERVPLDNRPVVDKETMSYDGDTYYMVYYYKCLRLLLYPQLSATNVNSRILLKCAEACGGVCRAYQRLHRQTSVGFSLMALYSIFLAGLTLIYCIWMSPKDIFTISTNNDLNACSIVLYVIAERWPGARKYRDAFESIKQCIMDSISEGEQLPRKPLIGLDANLRATLEDVQNLHPEGREDFGRMISDMLDVTSSSAATSPAIGINGNSTGESNMGVGAHGKWVPGVQMGIGIADFQAQAMYGAGIGYQYSGSITPQGMGQFGSVWQEGGGGFDGTTGYGDQGGGMEMPNAMDLLDGFDMEDFLNNPNAFGEGIV